MSSLGRFQLARPALQNWTLTFLMASYMFWVLGNERFQGL